MMIGEVDESGRLIGSMNRRLDGRLRSRVVVDGESHTFKDKSDVHRLADRITGPESALDYGNMPFTYHPGEEDGQWKPAEESLCETLGALVREIVESKTQLKDTHHNQPRHGEEYTPTHTYEFGVNIRHDCNPDSPAMKEHISAYLRGIQEKADDLGLELNIEIGTLQTRASQTLLGRPIVAATVLISSLAPTKEEVKSQLSKAEAQAKDLPFNSVYKKAIPYTP
jgi:hypothetical protein